MIKVTAVPDTRSKIDTRGRQPAVLIESVDGLIVVDAACAIELSKAILNAAAEALVHEREWEKTIS